MIIQVLEEYENWNTHMKAQKDNAFNLFGREGSREVRDKAGV